MTVKRFGYGLTDEDLQESPVWPYVRWEDYERVERAALAYVREEMADDPRIVEEGGGLHELAKVLGLVTGD